eukprot:6177927-Pleurochrysis_carterae.AAC.3
MQFVEGTVVPEEQGTVNHRRRRTAGYPHKNHIVDNRWIVQLHNPWLLFKYDCHINVETKCDVSYADNEEGQVWQRGPPKTTLTEYITFCESPERAADFDERLKSLTNSCFPPERAADFDER